MKNIKNNLMTELPLFPLDKCILLPGGNLPLNIFEERYIQMVDYALSNNRIIGMIQKKRKHIFTIVSFNNLFFIIRNHYSII